MLRFLGYCLLFLFCALFLAWVATLPAPLVISVASFRVVTSPIAAASFFLLALGFLFLLFSLFKNIFFLPARIRANWKKWRQESQRESLNQAIAAFLSGDKVTARQLAHKLKNFPEKEKTPLSYFLEAQIALNEEEPEAAFSLYQKMRTQPAARLLGLFGLYQEAMKSNAMDAALDYAREASFANKLLPWANNAILGDLIFKQKWPEVFEYFYKIEKAMPRQERYSMAVKQQKAALFLAQALALEKNELESAKNLSLKACKLAPHFTPAVTLAARFLYQLGKEKKASHLLETAWARAAHPDIAQTYIASPKDLSSLQRLKRARKLADLNPSSYEAAFCVAAAAYAAQMFEMAYKEIAKALEIEKRESAVSLAQKIFNRLPADKQQKKLWESNIPLQIDFFWIGDQMILKEWAAISPIRKIFNAVSWKRPIEQIDSKWASHEVPKFRVESATSLAEARLEGAYSQQKKEKDSPLPAGKGKNVNAFSPYDWHEGWHSSSEETSALTPINVDDPGVEQH